MTTARLHGTACEATEWECLSTPFPLTLLSAARFGSTGCESTALLSDTQLIAARLHDTACEATQWEAATSVQCSRAQEIGFKVQGLGVSANIAQK